MPRQWVWAMTRPPAAAASSRKSSRYPADRVATRPKVIGTRLLAARACIRARDRSRSSGSGAAMAPSVPSKMPVPTDPMTPTSSTTSSHDARRDATGRSSEVSWCSLRDVEKPMAPAWRDSASWRFMTRRSSSVDSCSKARSPMAQVRRAECPTLAAKLMPLGRRSTASRYCGKVSKLQSIPAARAAGSMSSARSRFRTTSARSSGRTGASVNPQFPITAVVTPCQHELLPVASQNTWASMWV